MGDGQMQMTAVVHGLHGIGYDPMMNGVQVIESNDARVFTQHQIKESFSKRPLNDDTGEYRGPLDEESDYEFRHQE